MIEKIKKYFNTISKILVLEQVNYEQETEYNLSELSLRKGNFKIHHTHSFKNLGDLKKLNKNKLPVLLLINGRMVLTKTNPSSLDSFSEEQFYLTEFTNVDNTYYSIARKDIADDCVTYLEETNVILLDVFVGPLNAIHYFETQSESLMHIPPFDFSKIEGKYSYSFEGEKRFLFPKIQLEEFEVGSNFIPSIYSGIEYLAQKQHTVQINPNKTEAVFSQLIKPFLLVVFGLYLVVLSVNFFYQNYLSEKYENSELESEFLLAQQDKLASLEFELVQKQKVLNKVGISSDNTLSKYLDQLALMIPKDMVLNKLSIHPINKKLKNNKALQIRTNFILTEGKVNNVDTLNELIMRIEKHKDFKSAKIISFDKIDVFSKFKLEVKI